MSHFCVVSHPDAHGCPPLTFNSYHLLIAVLFYAWVSLKLSKNENSQFSHEMILWYCVLPMCQTRFDELPSNAQQKRTGDTFHKDNFNHHL